MEGKQAQRQPHSERLGFRIDSETKDLIERAAELEHRKLTDYCVSALSEAARRTVAEHDTIVLSARDRARFFELLMNPPEPNDRLRRAMEAEEERVRRD